MIHIGDLVRVTNGQYNHHIGIVLDYRRTGRFYPSNELTIKLPNGATIIKDRDYIEKLGENNDQETTEEEER
jgi:hypothetical protein